MIDWMAWDLGFHDGWNLLALRKKFRHGTTDYLHYLDGYSYGGSFPSAYYSRREKE
jgi:hypothetical protein